MTGLSGHELRLSAGHALTSTQAASCDPTCCCSTGVPGVTQIDNAGPTSSETPDGCHRCGGRGNLGPYTAGFRAGYQQAQLDTYTPNILATQRREQAEAERQRVRRYGE